MSSPPRPAPLRFPTLITPAEKRSRRRSEIRRRYMLAKGHARCAECGEDDDAVLDYHHTYPESKEDSVSSLVQRGCSWSRISKELTKCTVLCANCHRRIHAYGGRITAR